MIGSRNDAIKHYQKIAGESPGERVGTVTGTLDRYRKMLLAISHDAIDSVQPGDAMRDALRIRPDKVEAGELFHPFALQGRQIAVIALGKAALTMSAAALDLLGDRIVEGIAVARDAVAVDLPGFEVLIGGHPQPDEHSLRACEAVEAFAKKHAAAGHPFLVLLSGGASSLVAAPLPGMSLEDVTAANQWLLESGHNIRVVNLIRRKITRLGGGGLSLLMQKSSALTLAISDVVHGAPEDIGSGPTLPDPVGEAVALRVVTDGERVAKGFPEAVHRFLLEGEQGNTPVKPDRKHPVFATHRFEIICDNRLAMAVARRSALEHGCAHVVDGGLIFGEAVDFGKRIGRLLSVFSRKRPFDDFPVGFVFGGESTVTLEGASGQGGRNMELALALVVEAESANVPFAALAFGTDGSDGSSPAAGALVDSTTLLRARQAGLDPAAALAAHDAHPFFEALGDLYVTGPTGTNVADLLVVIAGRPDAEGPAEIG